MSEIKWRTVRLGEVAGINEKSITRNYPHKVIEYIDTSSVTRNIFSTLQSLELSKAPTRARRIVSDGDTILSTVRPIQRHFGFIHKPKPNTVVSTGFAVITPKKIDPKFLFYLLSQDSITLYLDSIAETSTTTFPAFRPEVLNDLEISIPENVDEQRRIAEILSALDEKIELNRQTNATLEAIAQAIFKEWFVDFNYPGATGEMVESELGLIPKGWKVAQLGEVTDLTWGDTNTTKKSYTQEGFAAYSASGLDGYLPYYDYSRPGIVVSAIGAYSGRTWLAQGKWSCIKNTIRFWSTNSDISNEYLFLYTGNKDFWPLRGSAQPFISQTDARNINILFPADQLAKTFGEIVRPLYQMMFYSDIENMKIAECRDLLLPAIMGQ